MLLHFNRDGDPFGPYPLEEAREYLKRGEILPTDLAWFEGAADWMPVMEVPGMIGTTTAGNPSGTGKQKPLPDMTQPDTKGKKKSWRPTRTIGCPILGIFFLLLLCLCIHGLFFGSYIPWDVKKEIIEPLGLLIYFFAMTFPFGCGLAAGGLCRRRADDPVMAGQIGCGFGFLMGCIPTFATWTIIFDHKETYFEKIHKPTPKEIREGWRPSR